MTLSKYLLLPIIALVISACGSTFPSSSLSTPQPLPLETDEHKLTEIQGENMEKRPDADVIFVKAVLEDNKTWTFHVTVEHPDTGWDDYVDGWDVVTPNGTVLKVNPSDPFTRILLHPHENEQPFTRSQSGISLPDGLDHLFVRAHDLVSGYGGEEIRIDLKKESGPGFEIHH